MINSKTLLTKIEKFIVEKARPLDKAVFYYWFEDGAVENIYSELQKFQNPDGGFGHGLEPDFQLPASSNMATTFAIQYFNKLDQHELPEFLHKGLEYFVHNYSNQDQKWLPVPREVNNYPHAFWWSYSDGAGSEENWGNPSVEIIGYLMQFKNNFDGKNLEILKTKALDRLFKAEALEPHELKCYSRFSHSLTGGKQAKVIQKLADLIDKEVERDSTKWAGYVSKPLTFVDSTKSPFYDMLKKEVELALDMLCTELETKDGWYPAWDWSDYLDTWTKVKNEIAGMVSVNNLIMLKRFGRL